MRSLPRPVPLFSQIQSLFFLSGFSALVFEVSFVMLLRYWVGNTAHAIAAVLSAFMGGLAIGSLAAGKWLLSVRKLLPLYGSLELMIGLYSVGMPGLMERLQPGFLGLVSRVGPESGIASAGNFLVGIAVLIFPTFLMGATFPVVVRAASQGATDRPEPAEKLYAANLVGAASGALLVDFVFIRFWGIRNTIAFAAIINLLVATWALALGSTRGTAAEARWIGELGREDGRRARGSIMAVALAGGFLVLFQEIVWTHMSGEFLDNSVYGFAVTLFAVMAGLAAGALLVPRHFGRLTAESSLAWICAAAGALVIFVMPFWESARVLAVSHPMESVGSATLMLGLTVIAVSPRLRVAAYVFVGEFALVGAVMVYRRFEPEGSVFWTHHIVDYSVCVIFMFFPAVLMGMVLPLVLGWHLEGEGEKRISVASVYTANTLGCVAGIAAATFWAIPRWGIERSGRGAGLALLSLGLILASRRAKDPWRAVWVLIPALAWTFLAARWDFSKDHAVLGHRGRVVFAREDLNGGVTTVLKYAGIRQIYANGVYEAGNDFEALDQARLALLPILQVRETSHATIIGVGSGQTAGIIGLWPFRSIDVVDYSPGVLEAARNFFEDFNLGILKDPRVRLRVADGRHYLGTHTDQMDLIVIEVSRLWQAGEGDLYTREFYAIASSRLENKGILEQWLPIFNLSIPDTVVLLRTVRAVFPYVALYMGSASGMIVASHSPLVVYAARLKEADNNPKLADVLKALEMPGAESLLGDCVLTPEGLDALLAREDDKRVSTDLWPRLEYSNARYYLGHPSDAPLRRFLLGAETFRTLPVVGPDGLATTTVRSEADEEHARLLRSQTPL
jgi:spermidine synthase